MEDNFNQIRNQYKSNVEQISLHLKKKYFNHNDTKKNNKSNNKTNNMSSLDDTFDVFFKNKCNYNLSNFDLNIRYSNNIFSDIIKILKITFGINYFDDNAFKCVKNSHEFNYLNPKEGEQIIYNSLRKSVFQQSDFRKDLYIFEEKVKDYILQQNKNNNVKINFFEDEEYSLVWMIIEISENKN